MSVILRRKTHARKTFARLLEEAERENKRDQREIIPL